LDPETFELVFKYNDFNVHDESFLETRRAH